MVAGERFDVILSDLMMPDLTGADLHAQFLHVAPDQAARMIVLTGGATTAAAQGFLSSDVVPIVFKPFVPADVFGPDRTCRPKWPRQRPRRPQPFVGVIKICRPPPPAMHPAALRGAPPSGDAPRCDHRRR